MLSGAANSSHSSIVGRATVANFVVVATKDACVRKMRLYNNYGRLEVWTKGTEHTTQPFARIVAAFG